MRVLDSAVEDDEEEGEEASHKSRARGGSFTDVGGEGSFGNRGDHRASVKGPARDLEAHHSHFILIDSGSGGEGEGMSEKFAAASKLRRMVEEHIHQVWSVPQVASSQAKLERRGRPPQAHANGIPCIDLA